MVYSIREGQTATPSNLGKNPLQINRALSGHGPCQGMSLPYTLLGSLRAAVVVTWSHHTALMPESYQFPAPPHTSLPLGCSAVSFSSHILGACLGHWPR